MILTTHDTFGGVGRVVRIILNHVPRYLCACFVLSLIGCASLRLMLNSATGKVFLPFEGDRTMAIILSKAFLLADDKKIKDPTILSQIRR